MSIHFASSLGDYQLFGELAAGGMGTVHFGRLAIEPGVDRPVAVKRLHPEMARERESVRRFLDEAALTMQIRHPNVVETIETIDVDGEVLLVMEYIAGASLAELLKRAATIGHRIPVPVALRIACDGLAGLHAAHTTVGSDGSPLRIVHRDVSPNNIIVALDGVARMLDFGVASAVRGLHQSKVGEIRGTLAYMAPEQIQDREVSPRTDVFGLSVTLWEALTGVRLFRGGSDAATMAKVLEGVIVCPSTIATDVPAEIGRIVLRGLERDPLERFGSALEMARALEAALPLATTSEVAEWVRAIAGDDVDQPTYQCGRQFDELMRVQPAPTSVPATRVQTFQTVLSVLPDSPISTPHPSPSPPPRRHMRLLELALCGVGICILASTLVKTLPRARPRVQATAHVELRDRAPTDPTRESRRAGR